MLKDLKKQIDRELAALLRDLKKRYKFGSFPAFIYDGIKDFVLRDGKRIRPALFTLSYLGYAKKKTPSVKEVLRSALAFELLHDFLLVHDDVIDESDTRRGKPTLHKFYEKRSPGFSPETAGSLAIVAGDIIFAMAIETFMSIKEDAARKEKALAKFSESAVFTGVGEFLDVMNEGKLIGKMSEKEILTGYELKTARYTFETPLVAGAILAGASDGEIKKLTELGIKLGIAFQILDDLLDITATFKETGKPAMSDIKGSKKTIIAAVAYRKLSGKQKEKFSRLFGKINKTKKDIAILRELVYSSGAVRASAEKALSIFGGALKIVSKVRMNKFSRAVLEGLSDGFLRKLSDMRSRVRDAG